MILIISTAPDLHADVVQQELERRGAECIRFNTEDFPTKVGLEVKLTSSGWQGVLHFPQRDVELSQIRAVYYRRPATPQIDPAIKDSNARQVAEAQCEEALRGLWRALDCFWMSCPLKIRRASSKLYQLSIAPKLGFRIPDTLITTDPSQAEAFFHSHHGQVVVKPLSGVSFVFPQPMGVYTSRMEVSDLAEIDAVRFAPTLLQEYIPKEIELRITVVREQVFAAEIHSQTHPKAKDDWRRISPEHIPHRVHELPQKIQHQCIELVRYLGLEFGAIDMIKTPDGQYVFIEINPNGQWLWIEEFTGLPIAAAIAQALISADS